MVLSIIIILFIFTVCCGYVIYRYNRESQDLQQQFNQIIGLRQLIFLLRFHRRESHNRLLKPTENNSILNNLYLKVLQFKAYFYLYLVKQSTNTAQCFVYLSKEPYPF